ncbi:MAG: glycosyltransferase family 2 protein [Candidatus Binatia bacterium]
MTALSERPAISIVVLNWNQRDATLACLDSLARADLMGANVLVVDNGSRDGTAAAVRAAQPLYQVLELPENRGYAGGNNAGIGAALYGGAELILLLNNDTTVAPDFLLPLLWALKDRPDAAAVCAGVHRADRPEMLDVAYSEVRFREREAVKIRGVNALPGQGFAERREVEVAIGCCLLLRAEAVRQVGALDEAFFAYHEDVDWCLRARKAGWTLLYEPNARVYHSGSGSTIGLHQKPAAPQPFEHVDLPNAEPLPYNPVRTYLGARNLVRLLQMHATRPEKIAFLLACLREIPLEYAAVVFDREGWLRLRRWGYRDLARHIFIERQPVLQLIRAAERSGRTAEFRAYLRGLWDGLRDRPLPLEELGLR